MRKLFPFLLMTLLALTACEENIRLNESSSKLVVEGWIEAGGFPVVLVTRSLPVTTDERKAENLSDYVVRWAKVSVICDADTVVLTGRYDKGYFPPFIYTTTRMRGQVGKAYKLIVEYRDLYATATTTLPKVPTNCEFLVKQSEGSDSLFQLHARLIDPPSTKNYYQLFTRVGTKTKQYQASYLGSIDDAVLRETAEIPVYRGHQLKNKNYTPYFKIDDTVSVKLTHLDATSFRIWNSYTKTLSLSGNLFLSTSQNMESNVIGGYGYWCGYGSLTKHIVIREILHQ